MNYFEEKLEKYAELAIRVGINIQKNQTLVINAPIEAVEFVRKLALKAYENGAKNVHVEWNDEQLGLIKFMKAPEDAFKEFPVWRAKGFEEMAKDGAAFLSISASNPDLLKDVDPERVAAANKTASVAMQEYRKFIQTGRVSWSVVSIPTKAWSDKVFSDLNESERVDKLWENIFKVTRVDNDNPVKAWEKHISDLNSKINYLNGKRYRKLYYKAPGTDLVVELPEKHLWIGGGLKNEKGTYFIPNMPTEEVFTMPLKSGVNGVLSSTKPLNYSGNLIENFTLTFRDGRIVDFNADKGREALKKLIETDEGSHYLGEVALVPHHSPVSDADIIFYNTLFDENASNHFAIGAAYPLSIEGGTDMNKEDLERNGANTSLTHVDFMVGSAEMNIDGETSEGKFEPIFRNGNWAF